MISREKIFGITKEKSISASGEYLWHGLMFHLQ